MHRSYPLHIHLWLLFGSLVLLLGILTCGINFLMTKSALEAAAADTTQRISREALDEVDELMVPAQMAIRLISHSSLANSQLINERLARVALVRDALDTSPMLQSLYIGYADGSFFYVRPLREEGDHKVFNAPIQAVYAVRSIEHINGEVRGRLYFLDNSLAIIQTIEADNFAAKFDPRQRPWFVSAMATGGLIHTEPYVFFSDQQAGATLALATASRGAVVGGDFRLDLLGKMLSSKKTIARSVLALLDFSGHVIAIDRKLPESAMTSAAFRSGLLSPASDYGVPILTLLASNLAEPRKSTNWQSITTTGGEAWYTTIDALTPAGGKPLFLLSAIPQDELLKGARYQALLGIGATGFIILMSLPLIWLVARRLSKSLHTLADGVEAVGRFDFLQPIAVRSHISEVRTLGETTEQMRQTIQRFLIMVQAISAESRLEQLLPLLLRKMLNAAGGAAGVLYISDENTLTVGAAFDRNGADITPTLDQVNLEQALPLITRAAAGVIPQTGLVTPGDARSESLGPLLIDIPRHAAAIPLASRQHELQGVLLILRDTPMDPSQLGFIGTLASLCAGALEVRELTEAQRKLFDAFIRVMAGAIDAKSPHTGGHCERVPELVKMLAQAACDATEGPYESFQMTEEQWEALHVAAWLHDCGKVTTPEYVIEKATKLETMYDRIHEIRMRFEVLKREVEIDFLRAQLAGEDAEVSQRRRDTEIRKLDEDFAFVATCNQGGEYLGEPQQERLKRIASRTWTRTLDNRLGLSQEELARMQRNPAVTPPVVELLLADKPEHLIEQTAHNIDSSYNPWGFKLRVPKYSYNRGELHNLLVGRGTLTVEERFKIEDHIVQTQIMLSRIPFPKHLREVPEIAGNHHEKVDGTGYPRQLNGDQMSALARMMAIADVFEALTAADRPYKKAKTLSESVGIMATAKAQKHFDPELFDLFLSSGVYKRYAERFMRPEQMDDVDIQQYISAEAHQKADKPH